MQHSTCLLCLNVREPGHISVEDAQEIRTLFICSALRFQCRKHMLADLVARAICQPIEQSDTTAEMKKAMTEMNWHRTAGFGRFFLCAHGRVNCNRLFISWTHTVDSLQQQR